MNIGYLGPKETYSHNIAKKQFPTDELIPYKTEKIMIKSLRENRVDKIILPIKNSLIGKIKENSHALSKFRKEREIAIKIILHLGCRNKMFKKIISKDHALVQCTKYLEEFSKIKRGKNNKRNYLMKLKKERKIIFSKSTSEGAIKASKRKNLAAIGSEKMLKEYGLKIIRRNIGDSKNSKTTFGIFSKKR